MVCGDVSRRDDQPKLVAQEIYPLGEVPRHFARHPEKAQGKTFIPAPVEGSCEACAQCPHMRLNTLEKLYLCLRDRTPEITVPEEIRARALRPIQRMLELS